MDFPVSDFTIQTFVFNSFKRGFKSIYHFVNVKIHLHHLHVSGKTPGYPGDFCNWKVGENQSGFFCLANRFFGFDIYVLIKVIRLSVWGTEDIKIGGRNLTNINFANIGMQIKFINTLKFYQKSLVQLAQAATDNEKMSIAKITQQFLLQHIFL